MDDWQCRHALQSPPAVDRLIEKAQDVDPDDVIVIMSQVYIGTFDAGAAEVKFDSKRITFMLGNPTPGSNSYVYAHLTIAALNRFEVVKDRGTLCMWGMWDLPYADELNGYYAPFLSHMDAEASIFMQFNKADFPRTSWPSDILKVHPKFAQLIHFTSGHMGRPLAAHASTAAKEPAPKPKAPSSHPSSQGGRQQKASPTNEKRRATSDRRETVEGTRRQAPRGESRVAASSASSFAEIVANADFLDVCLALLPYSSLCRAAAVSSTWNQLVKARLREWHVLDETSMEQVHGTWDLLHETWRPIRTNGTPTHIAALPARLKLPVPFVLSSRVVEPGIFTRPLNLHRFHPTGVAFSGESAFVADRTGSLHRYEIETTGTARLVHSWSAPKDVLQGPEGVCCIGRRVYVCDRPAHELVCFDEEHLWLAPRRFGAQWELYEPTAIAECGGHLFVSSGRGKRGELPCGRHVGRIIVCTLDGVLLRSITHPLLREARGLAFVNEHLVATEYDTREGCSGSTRLLCFTLAGELRQVVRHAGEGGRGYISPYDWQSFYGCTVTGSGELHVVDAGAHVIRKWRAV